VSGRAYNFDEETKKRKNKRAARSFMVLNEREKRVLGDADYKEER